MDWKEVIRQWRALPEEEKLRRRLESIPRQVAQSFAFEGEPVDLEMLEAEHARWRDASRPDKECCARMNRGGPFTNANRVRDGEILRHPEQQKSAVSRHGAAEHQKPTRRTPDDDHLDHA